jgi:hypothetical protein
MLEIDSIKVNFNLLNVNMQKKYLRVKILSQRFVLLFVIPCLLASCYAGIVFSGRSIFSEDRRTNITVLSTKDECTIAITGPITNETTQMFQTAIEEAQSRKCSDTWIILSSGGGLVKPAMDIGNVIRSNGYNTQIHFGNSCASACGLIFISGKSRAISSTPIIQTAIGFHQVSRLSGTDKSCVTDANDRASKALWGYSRQMLPESSAKVFYDRVMSTDCNTMKYITSDEAEKNGISNRRNRPCKDCAVLN